MTYSWNKNQKPKISSRRKKVVQLMSLVTAFLFLCYLFTMTLVVEEPVENPKNIETQAVLTFSANLTSTVIIYTATDLPTDTPTSTLTPLPTLTHTPTMTPTITLTPTNTPSSGVKKVP